MKRQDSAQLARWAATILAQNGRKITPSTMNLFLERVGDDMENIRMELEKLISYTMGSEVVTAEDVKAITTVQITNKIFDMVAAITAGKTKRAMDLYEDLLSQDIDEKQAAELTVDYMGDSAELGKELDKVHNPVLVYVWLTLGIICIVVAAKTAFGLLDTGIGIAKGYFAEVRPASASEVVYTISPDVEKKVYDYTLYLSLIHI